MAGPWTPLVDAPTLLKALGDADLVVLDCRHSLADPEAGPRAYATGHLPNAWHAHIDRDLSGPIGPATGRHPLPAPDDFRRTAGRWGIGRGVQVVAYDDVGGAWAARAWWLLRYYGHEAVAVLDGGVQAFEQAGGRLTTAPPRASATVRFEGEPGHLPTVEARALLLRDGPLLDARDPERFSGAVEPIDPVAGHIPGATNAPFKANLAPDGRFRPPQELRARFQDLLAGRAPDTATVYCGSGVTAAHDLLALEQAGLPGAALYPGSWSEWVRDPQRPVARG